MHLSALFDSKTGSPKHPPQMELLTLIYSSVGTAQFHESKFEEIPQQEQSDFYLEEEEPQVETIKTMQFNSAMITPTNYAKQPSSPPVLLLSTCESKLGSNCFGKHSLADIDGKLCVSVGNSVIYNQKCYMKHAGEIVFMRYFPERSVLVTGSKGSPPQIVLWKYKANHLEWIQTLHQTHRSISVIFVSFIGKERMIALSSYALHQKSMVLVYEIAERKRKVQSVEIGKVTDVIQLKEGVMALVNQNGLHLLHARQLSLVSVYLEQGLSCVCLMNLAEDCFLLGNIKGEVKYLRGGQIVGKTQVHNGLVAALLPLSKQEFISSGVSDKTICHALLKENCIETLHTFKLDAFCRSSCEIGSRCVLGLSSGVMVSLGQLIEGKTANTIKTGGHQGLVYNRHSKKIYYWDGVKPKVISVQQGSVAYNLRGVPLVLGSFGTMVAYVARMKATELIVEDLTLKKLVLRIELASNLECRSIKFSQDGALLALGLASGQIEVYSLLDQRLLCSSTDLHSGAIVGLVWSRDTRFLKSYTSKELFYFQLVIEKDKSVLKRAKPKVAQDVGWSQVGRFAWETKQIWKEMCFTEDIYQIQSTGKYLFVSMSNGELRVYNNPSTSKQYQSFRLFSRSFELVASEDTNVYACSSGRILKCVFAE